MPEIFPAQDQAIGEVIAELANAGLVQDRDYWIHFTWDLRPHLLTTDEAYATWQSLHGVDTAPVSAKKANVDTPNDSEAGTPARRQQTKRR